MSHIRTLDVVLDISMSHENILKLCKAAEVNSFNFHVFFGEKWKNLDEKTPLSYEQAAEKFFEFLTACKKNESDTPLLGVYGSSPSFRDSLSFSMCKANDKVEISWGCLDATGKTFESGEKGFDYPFFIEKFLDIYEPFGIISLEATYF